MPMAAILPAVISAGGGIASSLISSKSQRDAQKRAQSDPSAILQRQQIQQQTAYGAEMGDVARRLLPQYETGVKNLSDYYRQILGGDNSAAMQALSPLIRARKNATASQISNADYLPRGGGRGAEMMRVYDDEAADIFDLIAGERRNARDAYSQILGDVGSRAANYYNGAAGVSGNAASLLGTIVDRNLNAGNAAAARSGETARGLGSALGPLMVEIFRGVRGGSSSDPTSRYPDSPW